MRGVCKELRGVCKRLIVRSCIVASSTIFWALTDASRDLEFQRVPGPAAGPMRKVVMVGATAGVGRWRVLEIQHEPFVRVTIRQVSIMSG